jgi:hypothetical protein
MLRGRRLVSVHPCRVREHVPRGHRRRARAIFTVVLQQ